MKLTMKSHIFKGRFINDTYETVLLVERGVT